MIHYPGSKIYKLEINLNHHLWAHWGQLGFQILIYQNLTKTLKQRAVLYLKIWFNKNINLDFLIKDNIKSIWKIKIHWAIKNQWGIKR